MENTLKNILANLFDKKNKTYDGRYLNQKAALHVAFLPNLGELLLRFTTSNGSDGKGVTFLRLITKCLQEAFPARLAYTGNINGSALTVVEKLHQIFIKHKLQVGFIESCTGGLLTASMVELAGSSAYLDAGVVSYANQAKTHFADVSKHTLSKYGAVSEETALEMVRGIMQKRKLNLAVSITGIAGPGGGTKTKPVGLVYIAIRYKPNSQNPKNPKNQTPEEVVRLNLAGQVYKSKGKRLTLYNARTQIRERAVKQAHFMMLKILSKFYPNI